MEVGYLDFFSMLSRLYRPTNSAYAVSRLLVCMLSSYFRPTLTVAVLLFVRLFYANRNTTWHLDSFSMHSWLYRPTCNGMLQHGGSNRVLLC